MKQLKFFKLQEIINLYGQEMNINAVSEADFKYIINSFNEIELYSENINELKLEIINVFNN